MCVETCAKNGEDRFGSDGNDLALFIRARFILSVIERSAMGCCFIAKRAHCPRLIVRVGLMFLCSCRLFRVQHSNPVNFCIITVNISKLIIYVVLSFVEVTFLYATQFLNAWFPIACDSMHVQNIIVCDERRSLIRYCLSSATFLAFLDYYD